MNTWDTSQPWHYLHCREGQAPALLAWMAENGWRRMVEVGGTVKVQSDNLLAVDGLRRSAREHGFTS